LVVVRGTNNDFPGKGCAKWLAANPLPPLPEGSFLAFDPPEGEYSSV
jgi:hypothetical protein